MPVLRENYDRNSISEFLNASLGKSSRYSGLAHVIQSIAQGAVRVNEQVQQAALADVLGTTGDTNVQGEIVQRLDAASSDIFVDELSNSGKVAVIGCEEIEDPVVAGRSDDHAYIVLMDPLDGSSNIDVAVSIGSIFGIWKRDLDEEVSPDSLLKPGNEQVAAVYVVYGSSTVMVAATENSVQGFTLDPATGQFFLTNRDIVIPEECPYYSTNEGNFEELDVNTRQAVSDLRNDIH